MEVIVKDSYRILIPIEVRNKLNIHVGDKLELEIKDDKIILTKNKNGSESNLIATSTNQKDSNNEKSRLEEMLQESNSYWDKGVLKHPPKVVSSKSPKASKTKNTLYCLCGNKISKNNKLKLNDEPICKDCINNLKEELKRDIVYQMKLKILQHR